MSDLPLQTVDDEAEYYGTDSSLIADEYGHDPVPVGTVVRKSYRHKLLKHVGMYHKAGHPIFHGVVMAAHHLISIEGMKLSGLGDEIKFKGYDINRPLNLVFLPYELEGACHLGVQVHRGNHDKIIMNRTYHQEVRDLLWEEEEKITNCKKTPQETLNKLIKTLNAISKSIVKKITKYEVHLTDIAVAFKPQSDVGCANASNVGDHRKNNGKGQVCSCNRDHYSLRTPKGQLIDIQKKNYTLEPGK